MTWQSELQQILRSKPLIKRALQGAGIALAIVIIFIFVVEVRGGDIGFGAWMFLPVIALAIAGAFGGIFYCMMDLLRVHGGWKKLMANVASVLVYIVTLYLSLILALNAVGLWN